MEPPILDDGIEFSGFEKKKKKGRTVAILLCINHRPVDSEFVLFTYFSEQINPHSSTGPIL